VLYRWFVGLNMDDAIWDVTVFTKNRERFLNGNGDIAEKFFGAVLEQARAAGYLSEDHFTVDGTLIEAWASHKSFKRGAGRPAWHGPLLTRLSWCVRRSPTSRSCVDRQRRGRLVLNGTLRNLSAPGRQTRAGTGFPRHALIGTWIEYKGHQTSTPVARVVD
jgi:hypothetical protein